jgi:CheY-like chemotaxis protein
MIADSLVGCRVLLVDDDDDLREVLQMALEARGASVIGVGRATDALQTLAAEPIDVVVSDIGMPDQTGFWLITKIRQVWADVHVPAVAITGIPFPADGVRKAGFDDVLRKPPNIGVLCQCLASLRRAHP